MFLSLAYAFNVLRWCAMRVFVKSFGCSSNLAEGEVLAGCLAKANCELVNSVGDADVVLYNTCAVKGPTEDRAIMTLRRVPGEKKLIVAGCLPRINLERLCAETRFDAVAGPADADRIIDIVRRVWEGERIIALEGSVGAMPALNLPRRQSNPVVSIIPINHGCLGSCSYCCVRLARGRLRSYGISEIMARLQADLCTGLQEFWLTSQDAAAYGRDIKTDLGKLLRAACSIKGDFRVRVGMMTPNLAADILGDLTDVFRNDLIFKFVHLPVQSGNDEVLTNMQRGYDVAEFTRVVRAFRSAHPDVTLSTDVICGFPGEYERAFQDTLRLVEDVQPDIVNVSKFFARPRTVAASMRESFVPVREIRRRSRMIATLSERIARERNRRWVGWEGSILIDEVGKIRGSFVGRNFAYKPVVVKSSRNLLGKVLRVTVIKAFGTYLAGKILGEAA